MAYDGGFEDQILDKVMERTQYTWVRPEAFMNGWGQANPVGAPVAFTRTIDDLVLLRGWVNGNTTTAPIFYLPQWACPRTEVYLPAVAWPGGGVVSASVHVGATGQVNLVTPITGLQWLSLDGLGFPLQPVF